jgi:hypothetical protein
LLKKGNIDSPPLSVFQHKIEIKAGAKEGRKPTVHSKETLKIKKKNMQVKRKEKQHPDQKEGKYLGHIRVLG